MSMAVFWVLLISILKTSGTTGLAARHGVLYEKVDGPINRSGMLGWASFIFRLGAAVLWGTAADPILTAMSTLAAIGAFLCLFPIAEYLFGEDE